MQKQIEQTSYYEKIKAENTEILEIIQDLKEEKLRGRKENAE